MTTLLWPPQQTLTHTDGKSQVCFEALKIKLRAYLELKKAPRTSSGLQLGWQTHTHMHKRALTHTQSPFALGFGWVD